MKPSKWATSLFEKSANAVEYIAQDKFGQNILLWRQEWRPTNPWKKLGWFLAVPTQQLRPDQAKKQSRFSDPTWRRGCRIRAQLFTLPLTKNVVLVTDNSWQNKEVSVLVPRPWIPLCGPARAPGCRHEVPYRGPCYYFSARGPQKLLLLLKN